MPVAKQSRYVTISTVLTKAQKARLDARQQALEAELGGRVTFAETVREVVEAGLETISHAPDSISRTSPTTTEAA